VGGAFRVNNAASTYPALYTQTTGLSNSIVSKIVNASNTFPSLYATTNGVGAGIFGENTGTSGPAGSFEVTNSANNGNAVEGFTAGTGAGVFGKNEGTGNGFAGLFQNVQSTNSYPAVQIETAGNNSNALTINHTGTGGNLAVFSNNFVNVARIDKTGKGFFNGTTQNSGADVAELFDVEGTKSEYEPGDVLVISEATDRTVEKSSSANSTKVAGVYATKPGVTLTEKNIDENIDGLVPMGVIGVIPTKVCLENGPIKRGDLLVTSSKHGHAMKAISPKGDGIFPAGTIIGKALENFDSSQSGLIKVLVNVK